MEGPQRGWEKIRIEVSERPLGLIKVTDEKEAPDFKIARKSSVQAVAMRFEDCPCSVECFRSPTQITRGERNLCLGDDAPGTGHSFSRTEGTRRPPQEFLRSREIAKLCHRNTAKREGRCIVAERDTLQGSEGIACCEGVSGCCDQRIHPNPATLVTPTPSMIRGKYSAWQSNSNSKEVHMCPACIESTAVMVAGAVSTGGFLAVCIGKFRKVFRLSSLFQRIKEK